MDSAKAAVKDFMAKSGHHDTTVHEKVAPAVTHETINRERHEIVNTAIDKEIHQDHYHTSIQPVQDREVLPEQHHHNLAAVEHRQFEHGNDREVAERLKAEAAQFRDVRTEGVERHTQSVAPTIAGEHIHHHVHETIQPVVNKETIETHVVHTTVPIHEVHHNAAQHHTASALPAVSMAEFKKQGGSLTGREERYDGFEGEPRSVGGHGHSTSSSTGLSSSGSGLGHSSTTGHSSSTTHNSSLKDAAKGAAVGHQSGHTTSGAVAGAESGRHTSNSLSGTGSHGTDSTTSQKTKPSLLDKLNPMKDTDHDGKKGFMD